MNAVKKTYKVSFDGVSNEYTVQAYAIIQAILDACVLANRPANTVTKIYLSHP